MLVRRKFVAAMKVKCEELELEKERVINDLVEGLAHAVRVSNLAYYLSKEMGDEESVSVELANAGMLHDVGKLRLASHLYGRAEESLTIEATKYMRLHSKISYEILKEHEYSEFVLETVKHHHENFDGSGYPDNLKGEEIPYGARIIRVCDVFSALTSDRPYRKAFDKETAMELMAEEFKNFDMKIFLAFQALICSGEMDEILENRQLILEAGK